MVAVQACTAPAWAASWHDVQVQTMQASPQSPPRAPLGGVSRFSKQQQQTSFCHRCGTPVTLVLANLGHALILKVHTLTCTRSATSAPSRWCHTCAAATRLNPAHHVLHLTAAIVATFVPVHTDFTSLRLSSMTGACSILHSTHCEGGLHTTHTCRFLRACPSPCQTYTI